MRNVLAPPCGRTIGDMVSRYLSFWDVLGSRDGEGNVVRRDAFATDISVKARCMRSADVIAQNNDNMVCECWSWILYVV